MKVFISADIEGVTATTIWDECTKKEFDYSKYTAQMTREVVAACEGAIAAGADEIVVKDSHGSGTNIDIEQLPENVQLIRAWSGHPYSMVEGLDGTFDALMFVGYHSGASKSGNALSHTMTGNALYIKINEEIASEFMIFSLAGAREGVPTVFLSGDKMLCEDYEHMHPNLMTVAVKEGDGALSKNLTPKKSLKLIREVAEQALKQDLTVAKIELPKAFDVEMCFKDQKHARKMSFYPGMIQESSTILRFKSEDYFEVLRMFKFVL